MKKSIMIPLLMLALLSMAACSDPNEEPLTPEQSDQPENPGDNGNSDSNDPNVNVDNNNEGNITVTLSI